MQTFFFVAGFVFAQAFLAQSKQNKYLMMIKFVVSLLVGFLLQGDVLMAGLRLQDLHLVDLVGFGKTMETVLVTPL